MVLAMTLHYGKAFFIAGDYIMVPKGLLCVNKGRGGGEGGKGGKGQASIVLPGSLWVAIGVHGTLKRQTLSYETCTGVLPAYSCRI